MVLWISPFLCKLSGNKYLHKTPIIKKLNPAISLRLMELINSIINITNTKFKKNLNYRFRENPPNMFLARLSPSASFHNSGTTSTIFCQFSRKLQLRFYWNFVHVVFMMLLTSSLGLSKIAEFSFFIIDVFGRHLWTWFSESLLSSVSSAGTSTCTKHQL